MPINEGIVVTFQGDASDLEKAARAAQAAVDKFNKTSSTTGAGLGNFAKGSDKATNALVNLSRVAQDAPYGFIGIANNLNPLLESFQRLQAETGSTKAAFSSLVGSLTGPAGIGLALGVVSSLLVQFGGELLNSGKDAERAAKQLDLYKQSLDALENRGKNINNAFRRGLDLDRAKLKAQGASEQDIFEARQAALRKRLDLIFEEQGIIKASVTPFGRSAELMEDGLPKGNSPQVQEARKRIQELQQEAFDINNEININNYENQARINEENDKQRKKDIDAWKKYIKELEGIQKELQLLLRPKVDYSKDVPKVTDKYSGAGSFLDSERLLSERNNKPINLSGFSQYDLDRQAMLDQYTRAFNYVGKKLPKTVQLDNGLFKDLDAITSLDQLQEGLSNMLGFAENELQMVADLVDGTLAPAFDNLFNAIMAGEDPLKSFFDGIGQSVVQLINQLIQAAIQAAILSLFTGGASNGGQSFMGAFRGITGMATGGIIPPGFEGDRFPAMLNSGEAVMPLDKLHHYINPQNGGSVRVTGRLRGNDMMLQDARTNRRQRRTR